MADREQERREREYAEWELPASYYLDESDPDILVLRREDGTFVAAFSATGATKEGIVEAAKQDYRDLLEARHAREGKGTEE